MHYWLLFFPILLNAQAIQLAPPQITSTGTFFLKHTSMKMAFDLEGASIHYSLTGEPTEQSPVYRYPIEIRKSTTLRAVATHPDFLMSPIAEHLFIQAKRIPTRFHLLTTPHPSYPGKAPNALVDLQKGSSDLHDGNWLGFMGDTVVIEGDFRNKIQCKSLIISTLVDIKAWILPCRKITILGQNQAGVWEKIGQWQAASDATLTTLHPTTAYFIPIVLQPYITQRIRIEIVPFGPLPQGHAGAGTPAWLFLDEIVFQ